MLPHLLQDLDVRACIGWALLHSTWQAVVAWTLYSAVCFARARPTVRYIVGNACLLAFVIAQLLTIAYVAIMQIDPSLLDGVSVLLRGDGSPRLSNSEHFTIGNVPDEPVWARWAVSGEPYLRVACWVWAAGLLYRVVLTVGAMAVLQRECRRCAQLADPWRTRALDAYRKLQLTRSVKFLECGCLTVPATAGWLKPVVLVPTSTMLNLSPDHVEALIVHELAHIARRDYLANLLRGLLDALYFFHPLIRSMVRQLADDAEQATDEVAVRAFGNRKTYAEALVTLNETRAERRLLLGADGGSVKGRLLNLLANHGAPRRGQARLSAVGPLLAGLMLVVLCSQSIAFAAAERNLTERGRSQTLCQAIVADLSSDQPNPAAEAGLAMVVADLRAGRVINEASLRTLAHELLRGVPADLLLNLDGTPFNVPLIDDAAPTTVARFGTKAERGTIVRQMLAAAQAQPARKRAARREFARAAVILAALWNAGSDDANESFLLTHAGTRAMLDLTPGERRRLDMALRADRERIERAFACQWQMTNDPAPVSDTELLAYARRLALLPRLQSPTGRSLRLDQLAALATVVRGEGDPTLERDLQRLLYIADMATFAPERFQTRPMQRVTPAAAQ